MTIQEIKQAVNKGKEVCHNSALYKVVKDKHNQYFIKCTSNNHCIGLTNVSGTVLNGREKEFFIKN